MRIVLAFIALVIVLVILPNCQENQTIAADVGPVLDSLDQRLEWLDYRLDLEKWEQASRGEADSLQFFEGLLKAVLTGKQAVVLVTSSAPVLDDPTEEKRYLRVKARAAIAQVELDPGIAALRDTLNQIRQEFTAVFDGRSQSREHLQWVVANDRDRTRRELAQNILDAAGEELADGVQRLIRLRNQLAQKKGYNNYLALVFDSRDIDPGEYVSLLNRIETETSDKYSDVLKNIKRQLGRNMLDIWDLEFASSDVRRRVDAHFPVDSQLAFVRQSLLAIGYDIQNMPLYFDLREFPDEPAEITSYNIVHGYDHRILGNLTPGLASTRRLMLHTGRMLYAASISRPNESDARHPDRVWEKAMAGILAAFCDDPEWLETHAHLSTALAAEYSSSLKQQRLITLRRLLTNLMFEYEAYQNANRDLNELYWNVYEKHIDLTRHDQVRPWADLDGLVSEPLTMSDELMADMIEAQTISFLKRNYQSLIDPQTTKAFLEQNYFRFGGRRDWPELLDRGTDEPLNHRHLLSSMGI